MEHPNARDFENFARDELGERKKERILAHCRQCEPCAERLLEAAREHPGETPPLKLSRWNVISIVVMVIALIAVVVTTIWLLRSMSEPAALDLPPLDPQGVPTKR